MRISAVLIGKNEEQMLPRCLESLKGIDEIIYFDTGSTDKSVEVAKKYTDKVYSEYQWQDNFAEARNLALAKATGDWILSIDCDEWLDNMDVLRKTVEELDPRGVLAVNCKLRTIYGPVESRQVWGFPRLFKRCPQVWWEGMVHNHLSVNVSEDCDVTIFVDYSPAHKLDPDRSFRILKKAAGLDPHGRNLYYLGREYWYREDFENAVITLGKYVQESRFMPEKADAFLTMARCYWAMRMANDARDACVQAIICNSHFKEAILFMAELTGDGYGNSDWQKKADQWKKMAETADNSNVLFVRT